MISDSYLDDGVNNFILIKKDSILQNYLKLKNANQNIDLAVVFKSDAYGTGCGIDVARALVDLAGCKKIFVGTIQEALDMSCSLQSRKVSIFLLYSMFSEHLADLCKKNNIIPVINSLNQLKNWINYAMKMGYRFPVAIKFDTGMNRLGVRMCEITDRLVKEVESALDVNHIMTHLACGGSRNEKNFSQYRNFLELKNKYFIKVSTSIAASNFVTSNLDVNCSGVVRIGGALYGLYKKDIYDQLGLLFPMQIKARILNIFNIAPGETVGYGATFVATKSMRLAVISIGYSDGLPHNAGSGNFSVKVKNKEAATVGVISMNLTTIDITDFDESFVKEGDFVEVVKDYDDICKIKDLIGAKTLYDAFCSFSAIKNKFIVEK